MYNELSLKGHLAKKKLHLKRSADPMLSNRLKVRILFRIKIEPVYCYIYRFKKTKKCIKNNNPPMAVGALHNNPPMAVGHYIIMSLYGSKLSPATTAMQRTTNEERDSR